MGTRETATELSMRLEHGALYPQVELAVDALSVYEAITATDCCEPGESSLKIHLLSIRDRLNQGLVSRLHWSDTRDMLGDGLTKGGVDRTLLHAASHQGKYSCKFPGQSKKTAVFGKYDPIKRDRNSPFAHPAPVTLEELEKMIVKLYELYNKDKVPEVKELLKEYEGREQMYLAALQKKYDYFLFKVTRTKYSTSNEWAQAHEAAYMQRDGASFAPKPKEEVCPTPVGATLEDGTREKLRAWHPQALVKEEQRVRKHALEEEAEKREEGRRAREHALKEEGEKELEKEKEERRAWEHNLKEEVEKEIEEHIRKEKEKALRTKALEERAATAGAAAAAATQALEEEKAKELKEKRTLAAKSPYCLSERQAVKEEATEGEEGAEAQELEQELENKTDWPTARQEPPWKRRKVEVDQPPTAPWQVSVVTSAPWQVSALKKPATQRVNPRQRRQTWH